METATYGSEFVAARIAVDQIIDLRTSLRYLGVEVNGSTYMFGDNESVVKSSTIPTSALSKRHNALSYHRVREAIAAGIIRFFHIKGTDNPADILSKHCGHQAGWPKIKPWLFWHGMLNEEDRSPDGEYQRELSGTEAGVRDSQDGASVNRRVQKTGRGILRSVFKFITRSGGSSSSK